MIKKILFSFILAALSVAAFAQKGRVFVASDFDGIRYSLPVQLSVTIGSKFEVKAVGTAEDIDWMVVEKEGSSLVVKSKRGNHRFDRDTRFYITMPAVENISLAGSGDITVFGDIKSDSFKANVAGSGDIRAEKVFVQKFSANVSGSGGIKIANGSASSADYNIAGSGTISARGLEAKDVDVNIAGSGDVIAFATDNLKVKIAGSGNVDCYGNPKNVEKMKFGSGSISIK